MAAAFLERELERARESFLRRERRLFLNRIRVFDSDSIIIRSLFVHPLLS